MIRRYDSSVRAIELLAPARDADTALAAIDHGADAVYMGGPAFSARYAAGNPVEDIARAADYAHRYRARLYITLNTILRDDELDEAEKMIREVCAAGADALIVQDMAVLEMDLPPVELHASTQAHIDSPQKAEFLHRAGFSRVVVARELSAAQIRQVAENTGAEIEAFVHGALCVSYSGQCYLSQAMAGRSANRGRCAQVCRMPFEVLSPEGRVIKSASHVLSLKDMNRSQALETLIDAGVSSLKIEGRLKDRAYVKNITAYYRRRLDRILERRPDLRRSSDGTTALTFRPDPERSFNRGFTDYLLSGRRTEDLSNPSTPKSLGQPAGKVLSADEHSLTTDSSLTFAPGDGFVVLRQGQSGVVEGFSINRAQGGRLFPERMPKVRPGDRLMRNSDAAFARTLAGCSAQRKVGVDLTLEETPQGILLSIRDESGFLGESRRDIELPASQTPQRERIEAALGKLGGTVFEARTIAVRFSGERFVPLSLVSALRREAVEALCRARLRQVQDDRQYARREHPPLPQGTPTDYRLNVSNRLARRFYRRCGAGDVAPAYEQVKVAGARLAVCRHCVKYSLGLCPRHSGGSAKDLPFLVLRSPGLTLRAEFDCAQCRMELFRMP